MLLVFIVHLLLMFHYIQRSRGRPQQVSVTSSAGWKFTLDLKPMRSGADSDLLDKMDVSEFVQDNWFVLTATLKDQFGVRMEEAADVERPTCPACRRSSLAISMTKIY